MTPRKVLVADDDDAVRDVLVRFARSEDLEPHPVRSGAEAVAALREQDFDLVLSDIDMPGLTGIQLLQAVRERDLDLPVVLVTGAPRMETAIAAVEHGATHYLTKPVDLDQLGAVVRRALQARAFARARRQLVGIADGDGLQIGDLAGLEARFDRALGGMFLHFQPIVRWSTKSTFGYEALLRSAEPTIPTPGALLDAAERLGRTMEIGRRVRAAVSALDTNPGDALLFVNINTTDLEDESLYDPESPLARLASTVVLEVTERARLEDVSNVRARIARLREMGFRIAIDDLGAGYAGLNSFASLEPEFMKLDRGLVTGLDRSTTKRKLVGAMIQVCSDLGVAALGEGLETPAERDALVDLGCDLLQGYLFARPGLVLVRPTL